MYKPLSGSIKTILLTTALFALAHPPHAAANHACPIPDTAGIAPPPTDDGRTRMTSDTAEVGDDGSSLLKGNVRLERGPNSLEADELYFNANTGEAEVRGNARFRTPNLRVESTRARIKVDSQEGEFVNTRFLMTDTGGRGEAKLLTSEAGIINLQDSYYTTCPEDDEFWILRAEEIALNTNTGWGEAWGSKLRLLDTTVFYLPYVWFPIDDRRQSGFLPPSFGNSSDTGFDFSIPYYINLAPNYDATLIPRFMSDRGPQMNAEFRYLTAATEGEAGVEYLHRDKQTDEQRDLILYRHQGLVTETTALQVDYTRVSDSRYFQDLDNTLSASSRNHLDQSMLFSWRPGEWLDADLLASRFQTINRNIPSASRPYRRLPRLRTSFGTPNVHGLRFDLDTELTQFSHENPQLVDGGRYVIEPAAGLVLDNGAAFWNSRLALHYTGYNLDNTAPNQDDNPSRSIPSFSSDMGLRFERLMKNGGLHMLEPRLFYLYIEEEDQDDLPIFDSGDPDFRFDRLFAENRYIGQDRIGDAHHVAIAITNRWLDPQSGRERTRLSFGQILRFETPQVILPNSPVPNENRTELVTDLAHNFNANWSSAVMFLVSTEESELNRVSARLRYYDERQRLFGIAYRFRDNLLEQTDVTFAWPLAADWRAIGRWNYSIRESKNIESLLGVEYTDCCWGIRAAVRRQISDSGQGQENSFLVELNLLGLGQFGKSLDRLLERDTLRSVYE